MSRRSHHEVFTVGLDGSIIRTRHGQHPDHVLAKMLLDELGKRGRMMLRRNFPNFYKLVKGLTRKARLVSRLFHRLMRWLHMFITKHAIVA